MEGSTHKWRYAEPRLAYRTRRQQEDKNGIAIGWGKFGAYPPKNRIQKARLRQRYAAAASVCPECFFVVRAPNRPEGIRFAPEYCGRLLSEGNCGVTDSGARVKSRLQDCRVC